MNRKHSSRKTFFLMICFMLAFVLSASSVSAAPSAPYENGALTAAPPAEDFVPRFVRNPVQTLSPNSASSFSILGTYLQGGTSIVGFSGTNVVSTGTTNATSTVDTAGGTVYMQQYTGSSWVDVAYSNFSANNTSTASRTIQSAQPKGYYYRTATYHYVQQGSVNESGWSYSAANLFN